MILTSHSPEIRSLEFNGISPWNQQEVLKDSSFSDINFPEGSKIVTRTFFPKLSLQLLRGPATDNISMFES